MILTVLTDTFTDELTAALYTDAGMAVSTYTGSRYGLVKMLRAHGVHEASAFDRHVRMIDLTSARAGVGLIDREGRWSW